MSKRAFKICNANEFRPIVCMILEMITCYDLKTYEEVVAFIHNSKAESYFLVRVYNDPGGGPTRSMFVRCGNLEEHTDIEGGISFLERNSEW